MKRKYKSPEPDLWATADVPSYPVGGRKKPYYGYDSGEYQDPYAPQYGAPAQDDDEDEDGGYSALWAYPAMGVAAGLGGLGWGLRDKRLPAFGEVPNSKFTYPKEDESFTLDSMAKKYKDTHLLDTRNRTIDMLKNHPGAAPYIQSHSMDDRGNIVSLNEAEKEQLQAVINAMKDPKSTYLKSLHHSASRAFGSKENEFLYRKNTLGKETMDQYEKAHTNIKEGHWGALTAPGGIDPSGGYGTVAFPKDILKPFESIDKRTLRPNLPEGASSEVRYLHPNALRAILADQFDAVIHPEHTTEYKNARNMASDARLPSLLTRIYRSGMNKAILKHFENYMKENPHSEIRMPLIRQLLRMHDGRYTANSDSVASGGRWNMMNEPLGKSFGAFRNPYPDYVNKFGNLEGIDENHPDLQQFFQELTSLPVHGHGIENYLNEPLRDYWVNLTKNSFI